jgi:hypothetical protein
VTLFLGRLSFHAKAHPIPLFQAMQHAAGAAHPRLALLLAGWFANPDFEAMFRNAASAFCPDVATLFLDARMAEARRVAWSVADLFVSPVDNIQETFGLSPVEAMAAGLPAIVSDWDGYRDTVRHGVDGLRIPTASAPEGVCDDLAWRFAAEADDYDHYIGAVSQSVAVDVGALAAAIAALANDPPRRAAMGAAGARRAREAFDWSVVLRRYQELWAYQATLRQAAPAQPPAGLPWPARPDPFRAFASYPTRLLADDQTVRRTAAPQSLIDALLASPMIAFDQPGLPARDDLLRILAAEGATVAARAAVLGPARRREALRAILFLAKYDLLAL